MTQSRLRTLARHGFRRGARPPRHARLAGQPAGGAPRNRRCDDVVRARDGHARPSAAAPARGEDRVRGGADRSASRARRAAGSLAFPGRVPSGAARERAAAGAAALGSDARELLRRHRRARGSSTWRSRGRSRRSRWPRTWCSCATVSTARARSRACRRSSRPPPTVFQAAGKALDDADEPARLAEPARVRRAVEDAVRRPLGRRQAAITPLLPQLFPLSPSQQQGLARFARGGRLLRHRHLRHAVLHRRSGVDQPVRPLPRQLHHRPGRAIHHDTGHFWLSVPKAANGFGPPFNVAYWHHGTTLFDTEMFIHAGRYAKNGLALVSIDAPGHGLVLSAGQQFFLRALLVGQLSRALHERHRLGSRHRPERRRQSPTREASSGRRTCSGRATTCGRPWSTRCR